MVLVTIRTAIIFIILLVIMRLMGKRQIGEMQPFELVITLLIAELACIPMADASIPSCTASFPLSRFSSCTKS